MKNNKLNALIAKKSVRFNQEKGKKNLNDIGSLAS